ncbi:Zinc finger, RING-type [Corchorus olitorius]|uniref:Zinc finger, RING-type n=1 Tax=Corchorus olitorius TaxID=93759 RepID=A0A1R3IPZ6_9ROSI|nr:Zinc finger, RING-type [Corchorus olitorius]
MRKPTKTKLICSICYEDLKPAVENLQSISVCGHVFHEHCLQRWFSSSSKSSSYNCPLCRKRCAKAQSTRLYFQSVEDEEDQRDYEEKDEVEITVEEANRWLDEKLKELEINQYGKDGSQVLASNRKYEAFGSSSRRSQGTSQPGVAAGGYVQPNVKVISNKRHGAKPRSSGLDKRNAKRASNNSAQTFDPFFF